MGRRASVDGVGFSNGCTNAISSILQSIESKQNDYKEGIRQNHGICKISADRISIGGGLEQTLELLQRSEGGGSENDNGSSSSSQNHEKVMAFLNEQRNRLKKISEVNVDNERNINLFMKSIATLKENVINNATQNDDEEEEDRKFDPSAPRYDENTNYEELIKDFMSTERENCAEMSLDYIDEKYCREIRSILGEKDLTRKRNRSGNDDDDDEIEVMRNNNTGNGVGGAAAGAASITANTSSLRCPITGMYMKDPVKNKCCGHVYSREGIDHHINTTLKKAGGRGRKGNVSCPVAGCTNNNLTKSQLEDDVETSMLVRRQERRENMETQHRLQSQNDQSFDVDD